MQHISGQETDVACLPHHYDNPVSKINLITVINKVMLTEQLWVAINRCFSRISNVHYDNTRNWHFHRCSKTETHWKLRSTAERIPPTLRRTWPLKYEYVGHQRFGGTCCLHLQDEVKCFPLVDINPKKTFGFLKTHREISEIGRSGGQRVLFFFFFRTSLSLICTPPHLHAPLTDLCKRHK
jgi:hypothetical protein